MNIPNYEYCPAISRGGFFSDQWSLILQQLISNLQRGVGQEGFEISLVSSDPASVTPPTAGGQLGHIQATFGTTNQNAVIPGTVVFDPYEQNGAILPARNGQLKVLLNDGTFHAITNT